MLLPRSIRASSSEVLIGTVKIDWSYDALNRLVEEIRDGDGAPDAGDYREIFAFDLAGNRVRKQRGWDTNQNGQFDAGEADNPVIYLYNQRDQLTSEGVDLNTDGIPDTDTTYTYDANGSTRLLLAGDQLPARRAGARAEIRRFSRQLSAAGYVITLWGALLAKGPQDCRGGHLPTGGSHVSESLH